jgi:hypothetical protein
MHENEVMGNWIPETRDQVAWIAMMNAISFVLRWLRWPSIVTRI